MKYISHSIIAALIMAVLIVVGFNPIAAATASSTYFIGREIAQAEYRWIEKFGSGLRDNYSFTDLFDLRIWNTDSLFFDLLLPIALCFAVTLVI